MVIGGTTERARNICSAWREEEEDALVVGRCDCDLYVCVLCYMVSINGGWLRACALLIYINGPLNHWYRYGITTMCVMNNIPW